MELVEGKTYMEVKGGGKDGRGALSLHRDKLRQGQSGRSKKTPGRI